MNKIAAIFLLGFIVCVPAWAIDEFDGIKCGMDIPKALMGKHAPNKRVMVTEKRHADLGLKDLGGIEISEDLFLISWRICGGEYAVLMTTTKNALIKDVLLLPEHSLSSPQLVGGTCKVGKKDFPEGIVAILDNSDCRKPRHYLDEVMLPAKLAWRIDEHQARFVKMPTEGLSCPFSGGAAGGELGITPSEYDRSFEK